MRRLLKQINVLSVFVVSVLLFAVGVQAAPTINHVQTTDVTHSGFSVIWWTSEPAGAGISIYSDSAGTTEITTDFEITYFPVHSGSPNSVEEYQIGLDKDAMAAATKALGLVKVSVTGCTPATTYYFKIQAEAGGETAVWPVASPASVTTATESSFVSDSRQLLLELSNDGGNLDATGWLVTANATGARSPVCEFVGDGTGSNQVYLNLSRIFAVDGHGWTPERSQLIDIQMWGAETGLLNRKIQVDFSGAFSVATVSLWDINIDSTGGGIQVTLADAIVALQTLARMVPVGIKSVVDINGDGHVGIAEVIYALQIVAELRQ